ncbi:hypothetical protein Tco_1027632, partial [Tanacetum coccineum]
MESQNKNQMGLLTMDDGIVNWGEHTEVEETNHALMAISSSKIIFVTFLKLQLFYNTLKTKLSEEQMNQLEEPEEEPEEELEPNNGHGDQFAQHPNPQPDNMNGWLEEDDDMNENVNDEDIEDEDIEYEDVEIEFDDDAELTFPYEV